MAKFLGSVACNGLGVNILNAAGLHLHGTTVPLIAADVAGMLCIFMGIAISFKVYRR